MQLIKDIDLTDYMEESNVQHSVLPASSWKDEVIDYFFKPASAPKPRLPWMKTHRDFELRKGEVTLWAGMSGHGKSMLNGHACLSLMEQGQKMAIASLEMKPHRTMARMSRQAFGHSEPTRNYLTDFADWTDGKLWIYDHVGSVNPKTMLAVIRYSIDKFQVDHFVIDNLMKVIEGEDSYNEQKNFVNGLCAIANDTGCHIHLVLHVKKLKDEAQIPNKFDIKGTGAVTDLVENIIIVWRNKPKEAEYMNTGFAKHEEPDAIILIVKQRNGDGENNEGKYGLWFDRASMQYMEQQDGHPRHMKIERFVDEVDF